LYYVFIIVYRRCKIDGRLKSEIKKLIEFMCPVKSGSNDYILYQYKTRENLYDDIVIEDSDEIIENLLSQLSLKEYNQILDLQYENINNNDMNINTNTNTDVDMNRNRKKNTQNYNNKYINTFKHKR